MPSLIRTASSDADALLLLLLLLLSLEGQLARLSPLYAMRMAFATAPSTFAAAHLVELSPAASFLSSSGVSSSWSKMSSWNLYCSQDGRETVKAP
jgi:nitrate reductase gamma subunit